MNYGYTFNLNGKTALVTGGKNGNLGPIWIETLKQAGVNAMSLGLPTVDVTIPSQIRSFKDGFRERPYGLDILIINAAIDNPPGSDASFFGNFKEIIDVNLTGVVNTIEAFIDIMTRGNIVIIGSMLGFIASNPGLYPDNFDKPCAYGAAKAGLWNIVNNLNMRYSKRGIITNMLALSAVDGKQSEEFKEKYNKKIPIGRMLKKNDFIMEFLCCCTARVPYDAPLFVGGGYTIY